MVAAAAYWDLPQYQSRAPVAPMSGRRSQDSSGYRDRWVVNRFFPCIKACPSCATSCIADTAGNTALLGPRSAPFRMIMIMVAGAVWPLGLHLR